MQRLTELVDDLALTAALGNLNDEKVWHELYQGLCAAHRHLQQNLSKTPGEAVRLREATRTAERLITTLDSSRDRHSAAPQVRQHVLQLSRLIDQIDPYCLPNGMSEAA